MVTIAGEVAAVAEQVLNGIKPGFHGFFLHAGRAAVLEFVAAK